LFIIIIGLVTISVGRVALLRNRTYGAANRFNKVEPTLFKEKFKIFNPFQFFLEKQVYDFRVSIKILQFALSTRRK
jgi:hypothetical protein